MSDNVINFNEKKDEKQEQQNVMAEVENTPITKEEVQQFISVMGPQGQQFNTPEGLKRITDELVNQQLMYLDAKKNKLDEDPRYIEEVEKTKESILKQFAVANLFKGIDITEEDEKKYYDEHQDQFKAKTSFKASHILVDNEDKAKEVKEKIDQGASFEDLAKEVSSCPSKERGGDLGTFTEGQMVPEFEKALLEQEIGTVSEPVKTQFGYHIIRLDDKKESSVRPFDEVKAQIKQLLLSQKQQELYLEKTSELAKEYSVKKFY